MDKTNKSCDSGTHNKDYRTHAKVQLCNKYVKTDNKQDIVCQLICGAHRGCKLSENEIVLAFALVLLCKLHNVSVGAKCAFYGLMRI